MERVLVGPYHLVSMGDVPTFLSTSAGDPGTPSEAPHSLLAAFYCRVLGYVRPTSHRLLARRIMPLCIFA